MTETKESSKPNTSSWFRKIVAASSPMSTRFLSIAFCLALFVPASAPAADGPRTASDTAWPPPHMRALPADYLDRLRHALQLQSDTFDTFKSNKVAPDVVKVRVGIAALALGQHVDECNARFGAAGFGWKPNEKFGFSLFSAAYVRLYALFNDRTGVMKGRLAPKAQANLEKSFWECAKVYSKLAEAKNDVWVQEGSENHHVTSGVSDLLVAQFLKDIPAYAGLKYDDGSTAKEQSKALWTTGTSGSISVLGRGYSWKTAPAMRITRSKPSSICDFAEESALRRKADMFLDLVFANFAEETLGSVRGGPKHRTKEEGFEARYYGLLFEQGKNFRNHGDYLLSTSSYYPSPVIVSLARDAGGRGAYSWSKRCPSFSTLPKQGDAPKVSSLDQDISIIRNGFATTRFHMGSHGFDATAEVDWQARQQRWQGIVFANHPMARISMDGKSDKVSKGPAISATHSRPSRTATSWSP